MTKSLNISRRILTLLCCALLSLPALSQIKCGVRAGANNVSASDVWANISGKGGFFVGPALKIGTPILDFDFAALYDQRVVEVEGQDVKRQTFDLQANIRKGFGFGDKFSIFVFAGPQFDFNLGKKGTSFKETFESVKDWRWKDAQLSLNIGFGVMLLNHVELRAAFSHPCGKTSEFDYYEVKNDIKGHYKTPSLNSIQAGATIYF